VKRCKYSCLNHTKSSSFICLRKEGDLLGPGELDVETLGAGGVGDVFELVAEGLELERGEIKRLGSVVLLEDTFVKNTLLLVPEAVEEGGVGEALDVLDEAGVVEHDELVAGALFANKLEGRLDLGQDHLAVVGTSLDEPRPELGLTLGLLFGTSSDILELELAEFGSGKHV
jgi:hypothetical protein